MEASVALAPQWSAPMPYAEASAMLRQVDMISRRYQSLLESQLRQFGVSTSGMKVLLMLLVADRGRPAAIELRTLRSQIGTSKANMTEVVTTLERRKLVKRWRLLADRRAAEVRLTDEGEALARQLLQVEQEAVRRFAEVLDPAEAHLFKQFCLRLASA